MQPAWLAEAVPQEKLAGESQQGHSCPPIPVTSWSQQLLALPRPGTSSYLPADCSHASFLGCIINHASTDWWWKCTEHPIMKVTHATL